MDEADVGELLIDLGANLGGAATGLVLSALGAPVMAALSPGLVAPSVAALARVARTALRQRGRRAVSVLAAAADARSMDPDQLALTIAERDRALEIAMQLLEAAAHSTLEDKHRAIAGALAGLVDADDIGLDVAAEHARAWRALDHPHFVMLRLIAAEPAGPPAASGPGGRARS